LRREDQSGSKPQLDRQTTKRVAFDILQAATYVGMSNKWIINTFATEDGQL
jgi:hypothetical protein